MISFVVEGQAVPQARPRFSRFANAVHTYEAQKCTDYKKIVAFRAKAAMMGREPIAEPLLVMIDCRTEPPKSWPKYKREAAIRNGWDTAKHGDADNIAKGIMDACTGIVWEDDCQVAGLIVTKRYAEESETVVEILEPDNNRSPIWAVSSIRRNIHSLE